MKKPEGLGFESLQSRYNFFYKEVVSRKIALVKIDYQIKWFLCQKQ